MIAYFGAVVKGYPITEFASVYGFIKKTYTLAFLEEVWYNEGAMIGQEKKHNSTNTDYFDGNIIRRVTL